jgi:TolB-like protein
MGLLRAATTLGIAVVFLAAVAAPPAAGDPAIRIAVIDFQGSGAVSGYETLGAGLQSMLTTDLAASHSIAVVERTKLAALRQEMKLSRSAAADPKTALRVGKLAGATHLVTGTFTLVGKELRLDARAIEIATGRVVLATDAKGERDAFFELEKKLANAIVAGIGVSLSPKERASMARIQTADFEAFRRFGDGLSLFDDADYDKSLEALREATTRDQEFGLARTTLETYQKMANEIRGRADVIDAEKRVQSAQARRQLRADEQAVIDRLMAVAARKGAAERKQRAAALYCAIRILSDAMEDEGLDRFARMRLRDALVTRYVREADGLFPDMPMVPFQPMGERWGGPEAPKSPADVDRAIAAAIDRFARYGQNPVKDAKEIQSAKEEHLQSIFSRTFKETAESMHLDYRTASDLLDRFYAAGARFSPGGRWRVGALETRAERRRWLLDVDASTRLYKEASTIETSPGSLRRLAEEVDSNAGIAEVLGSGRPDPCLREWVLSVLTQGPSTVRHRMEQDGKLASLCASDYVKSDRHRFHSGDLLDTLPVWLWGPSNGRPTYGGPQRAPGRFEDLRFLGKDRDLNGRAPWSAAIVEGMPRAGATLVLELHYDLPADSPCRPDYDCPSPAQRPLVTVFFDAGNVEVRAPRRNGNRDDVPMEAIGVALDGNRARLVDLHVLLDSERYQTTGPSATERAQPAQPLPLPASGAVPITVRREARRLVVQAAGREAAFDAPAATGGFLGFVVEGHGFVRIGRVRASALK